MQPPTSHCSTTTKNHPNSLVLLLSTPLKQRCTFVAFAETSCRSCVQRIVVFRSKFCLANFLLCNRSVEKSLPLPSRRVAEVVLLQFLHVIVAILTSLLVIAAFPGWRIMSFLPYLR